MDISTCELEPIRFPGAVQPHGALLVLRAGTSLIEAASESCAAVIGQAAERLVGQPLEGIAELQRLLPLLDQSPQAEGIPQLFEREGRWFAASASRNELDQILIDIEPEPEPSKTALEQAYRRHETIAQLRRLQDPEVLMQRAATLVRQSTGFDRVMIYRFDEDWNGEVLAESCAEDVEPYLGLHFPASDIPRQARELFRLSPVRLIADADYLPSALLAAGDRHAVDLGRSSLRSVSPVHLEYMRNMGVRASMVGSIVVHEQLWGLVACHHTQAPRYCPPTERDAFGWFCQDLASYLTQVLDAARQALTVELALRRRRLVDVIRRMDLKSIIRQGQCADLLRVVNADGFALADGEEVHTTGLTPPPAQVRHLLDHLHAIGADRALFVTHHLARDLHLPEKGSDIGGAMFVSLPHKASSTMIWFRSEQRREVRWAGNPSEPHTVHADGRISPRKSFAQFLENVRGQSRPWTAEETVSAAELGTLIEIEALRLSESFLRTVLDSSPEHICALDRNGTIVAVNDAWEKFGRENGGGSTAVSPVGVSYRQICAAAVGREGGNEAAPAWIGIQSVLKGRAPHFSLDYPCHSPTERRWFEMAVYPMTAPCEGVIVTHQNVTQRKLAELALQASEQRYLALLENQTGVICRFRPDGTLLFANEAFADLFGRPVAAVVGQSWPAEAWGDDHAQLTRSLQQLSAAMPVVTLELLVRSEGRDPRRMQFVHRGFFDESGKLIEIQTVGRDLSPGPPAL